MSVSPAIRASLEVVFPAQEQDTDAIPKRPTMELVQVPSSPRESSSEVSEKAKEVAYEDSFPDGGRGWLVVLGCFIYSASTVGWGCVVTRVC